MTSEPRVASHLTGLPPSGHSWSSQQAGAKEAGGWPGSFTEIPLSHEEACTERAGTCTKRPITQGGKKC